MAYGIWHRRMALKVYNNTLCTISVFVRTRKSNSALSMGTAYLRAKFCNVPVINAYIGVIEYRDRGIGE
jgi:hypothetical protein